ncbi:hypothetical protein PRIPAC_70710 [Pristionchus pacificus]|uniref:Uncharacterized protein n=1 Tax=Pristionchus pacificus TaxID=54126 RepID=A0A2A6C622_PRIPA|nr:hypothetical protein PRIPAC_70710 [Pristionchus pacificus]|eukprot:PDM73538.1 hypothetical protein PRIPAC_40894 [Pristionchus pacificus]
MRLALFLLIALTVGASAKEHDACYRKKTGQKPCDDQFDNCAMASSRGTWCVPVMKLFVALVRTFGGISYKGMW